MARKNEYGKYIISAGEIGTYTVCPESWRLRNVQKVDLDPSKLSRAGTVLHHEWSSKMDDAAYFSRATKLIVLLLLLLILFYLMS